MSTLKCAHHTETKDRVEKVHGYCLDLNLDPQPIFRAVIYSATAAITPHSCIEDFLSQRRQRVSIGNGWSTKADVLSDIPQSSVLGPILFTIFINDLPECVQSCCKVLADDTKIYDLS